VCDDCDGELYQRDDDRPETVRARLEVYREQTAPLIDYYRQAGLLKEVDGAGDMEAVSAALLEAIRDLAGDDDTASR
jgi:adenylate kinase